MWKVTTVVRDRQENVVVSRVEWAQTFPTEQEARDAGEDRAAKLRQWLTGSVYMAVDVEAEVAEVAA
jgi:hypothetical protein